MPALVEEYLRVLLDNQKLIMDALKAQGKAIKDLDKQAKKIKKTQASKVSVKMLRKEIEAIRSTEDIPLDLILEEPVPAAQAVQAPEQEADREPIRRRVILQPDDLEI